MLGLALMHDRQGKFDEANAMLVEGYEGLFTRRASIPAGNTSRVRIVAEMLRALAETRKSPEDGRNGELPKSIKRGCAPKEHKRSASHDLGEVPGHAMPSL